MTDMPERIWAERCPNGGDEWWTEAPTPLGLECLTEYIRADLPPKVKPLEWVKDQTGNSFTLDAVGLNSTYRIVASSRGTTLWRDCWTGEWLDAESVEAAKDQAQSNYESRILSALVQP